MSSPTTKTVLFLCTGNYYRSRFAEAYFNHRAMQAGLPWRATSAGLARGISPDRNEGPISPLVPEALRRRGVEPAASPRSPRSAEVADLAEADRLIALNEPEHTPMVAAHFPDWAATITYLDIPDAPVESPDEALPRLAAAIDRLVASLADRFPGS